VARTVVVMSDSLGSVHAFNGGEHDPVLCKFVAILGKIVALARMHVICPHSRYYSYR